MQLSLTLSIILSVCAARLSGAVPLGQNVTTGALVARDTAEAAEAEIVCPNADKRLTVMVWEQWSEERRDSYFSSNWEYAMNAMNVEGWGHYGQPNPAFRLLNRDMPNPVNSVALQEMYNDNYKHHYYHVSPAGLEDARINWGYSYNYPVLGFVLTKPCPGYTPLFHLFNGQNHAYTIDENRKAQLMAQEGYQFLDILGWVAPP